MPKEVEIDPLIATSSFATAKRSAVKFTGGYEIIDGKC
jgi:hypothetical protein